MEAALFIYAASLLDNFSDIFGVFLFLLPIVFAGSCFWYAASPDFYIPSHEFEKKEEVIKKRRERATKAIKFSFAGFFICSVLFAVTPKERTMYLMAGAYIGQQALTSEVSKDLQEIVGLKINKYKKELQKEIK